ncbi:hypothetical protein M436DRAFT_54903 [Aureobasidium namibiae CBS 147.97]|uniref:Zn(2)-C6 fungal-type domain-containing protein n=1 Tax=Aureobasidium namibiae CBS 147.97 TaxID=1043004 RepID=A0A074X5K7_9PEZI
MNQEEHSSASTSDSQFANAALQVGDHAGESIASASRSTAPPRKRAPLASVACQDCRRRKTKCDGKKPACSNCGRRGIKSCVYDLEPNQSRVAAYKQKIEQQLSSIKSLEEEIERLKKSPFHPGSAIRISASEPAPSSSHNASGGVVPMRLLLNPAPEPGGSASGHNLTNTLGPFNTASLPTLQTVNREAELLNYQRNLEAEMRKLQDENRTLQALIYLLNSMENRDQAQKMAQEIQSRGVSNDLLSRAQHLVATQVGRSSLVNSETQAKLPQRPGRGADNSSWSLP